MELRARISSPLRRAAMMAALVALAAAASAAVAPTAEAAKKKFKAPVVTKVSPLDVAVGETLTIRGRNFIKGRDKNTVVFKRDGARAVFAKAGIGTKRMLSVKVPTTLQEFFATDAGVPQPTRFRIRVLSKTFAKNFTKNKLSPVVSGPRDKQVTDSLPDGDCDGDGAKNRVDSDDDDDGLSDDIELSLSLDRCLADTDSDGVLDKWEFDCDRDGVLNRDTDDDDGDLLADTLESTIMSNPCSGDTDGDGVEDGFEYQSAKDLNDDEYQGPNQILAYPHKMPYPNPGFADAALDYDGDSLPLSTEYALWKYTYEVGHTATRTLSPLSYSDGMQYSLFTYGTAHNGRREPAQPWSTYAPAQQFIEWARRTGYLNVYLRSDDSFDAPVGTLNRVYDIRDTNLSRGALDSWETAYGDDGDGYVSDDERDEDIDGLSNYEELRGRMQVGYWNSCYALEAPYPVAYGATKIDDGDTDGDGVRDGADDQDHDDIPNLMELSRYDAADRSYDDTDHGRSCKPDPLLLTTDADSNGIPDIQENGNHRTAYGRVNPFNPCLPLKNSRTCSHFYAFGAAHAPFDGSPNWLVLQ